MKKLKLFFLTFLALMSVSNIANAETVFLTSDDFVGISFWLVTIACLTASIFFFVERSSVPAGWRVSITVAGLINGIAFIHYMYMRELWITTGELSIIYRYVDWLITTPLLMLEFYFVLAAINRAKSGMFWRLLVGAFVMMIGGYLGEADHINFIIGFIIVMAGWIYILYELFSGVTGKAAAKSGNKVFVAAFVKMRMIVTVGWVIYPLGYVFSYVTGGGDANSLNVIYNAADFFNKIAFGLIIWVAATQSPGRIR
tara:strand:+ start:314 stop:1081 length:768 start_codon:yes stop_codon:yes gene_type:complete